MLYNIICFHKKEYKDSSFNPLYYVFVDKYPYKFKIDADTYNTINSSLTELNILPSMVSVYTDRRGYTYFKLNLGKE